jgi:hypothetical protein
MHYLQVVITTQLEGTLKFAEAISQPINLTILKYPETENCQRDILTFSERVRGEEEESV